MKQHDTEAGLICSAAACPARSCKATPATLLQAPQEQQRRPGRYVKHRVLIQDSKAEQQQVGSVSVTLLERQGGLSLPLLAARSLQCNNPTHVAVQARNKLLLAVKDNMMRDNKGPMDLLDKKGHSNTKQFFPHVPIGCEVHIPEQVSCRRLGSGLLT